MDDFRDYRPIEPRGGLDIGRSLKRLTAPIVAIATTAAKWGFVFVKLGSIFVSFAAYSIWFHSWKFAIGFVLLILVHEMGHWLEARRQGLQVSWPTFIPFFGAYVQVQRAGLTPWRSALVSAAGPFYGGIGCAVVWAIGSHENSMLLLVLANIGFILNLFNMLPIGFLDGGHIVHAAVEAWRMPVIRFEGGIPMQALAPDRTRAIAISAIYVVLAGLLLLGLWRTHGAL